MYTGPNITTNQLSLILDTGNPKSYVSGSNIWSDLIQSNVSGSVLNGSNFIFSNAGGIQFDGIDDYINLSMYDLSWNNTNSVSFSVFLKPSSLSSYFPFIGKGPFNWEWQFIQNTTSLMFVYWNTAGGHTNGPVVTISNFFQNINEYVHLGMTWNHNNNQYNFYRNGVLINTTSWIDASINQNRTDGINIGGNLYQWSTSGRYWPGIISLIQIFNKTLSSEEILQIFNSHKSRFNL